MLTKIKCLFFGGESRHVFKGMLTLLLGAGLARVVGLASIPILTRIYSPENYGVLALYVSFVAILAPIATLRYVQAIPLPKTDIIAFNLFSLCLKLIVFFSFIVAFVLAVWGEEILGWFNMEALLPWRWLIVFGVAGTAFYELFSLWATRKRQYGTIARTQFTQSLIGNLTKIGLGLLAFKSSGMIIGQFLSQSAGITGFIKDAKTDFKTYLPKINLNKEKFVAKYYQDFVWYRLPSQFLMVLSVQAPIMMIAVLFDKEVTGQLSLAIMALSLPVGLIGGAMSKAYYAEVAALGINKIAEIKRVTVSIQKKLFLIGVPIVLFIMISARHAFEFLFGDEWALAGLYATILAPSVLFAFTSAPLIQVLNVIGSQKVFLTINIIRAFALLLFFIGIRSSEISPALFLVFYSSIMSAFFVSISFYIFIRMNERSDMK